MTRERERETGTGPSDTRGVLAQRCSECGTYLIYCSDRRAVCPVPRGVLDDWRRETIAAVSWPAHSLEAVVAAPGSQSHRLLRFSQSLYPPVQPLRRKGGVEVAEVREGSASYRSQGRASAVPLESCGCAENGELVSESTSRVCREE